MSDNKTFSPPLVLYLTLLGVGMGQTVIYSVMPLLGRELELDALVVMLPLLNIEWQPGKIAITSISAITALIFAITAPLWGRLSDRFGRKPLIILGLIGYSVGTLLFNSVAYFGLHGVIAGVLLWVLLVAARILHAAIMSATIPACNAYVIDRSSTHRNKALSKTTASSQLGVLMGPVLASTAVTSLLLPLFIQSAITFVCALLIFFYLNENRETKTPEKISTHSASVNRLKLAAKLIKPKSPPAKLRYWEPRFRFILPVGFFLYTTQGMVIQTLGFYCEDTIGLSRPEAIKLYATAMMCSSVAVLVCNLLFVQRSAMNSKSMIRLGLPICTLGYSIIAMTSNIPGMLIGMAFFGFGSGMVIPGFVTTASHLVSANEQGSLTGLTTSTIGFGLVVGPLTGGALYNFSENAPFWVSASSLFLLSIYVVINSQFKTTTLHA